MQSNKVIILTILIATVMALLLALFIIYLLVTYFKKQSILKIAFDKELLTTQLEIQEQTLQHISQELHDNIAQFLTLAQLHLTTLEIQTPKTKFKTEEAIRLIEHCMEEIRNISRSLNIDYITRNGLLSMIEEHINQLKKTSCFKIKLNISGESRYLEDKKEIMLFRIVQEALNNVSKHSKASNISISFIYSPDHLKCIIEDDGIGFNVAEKLSIDHSNRSSGLQNIIRRAKMINASYEINSTNNKGTRLCITIPD